MKTILRQIYTQNNYTSKHLVITDSYSFTQNIH